MKKLPILLVSIALLLSACAGAEVQVTEEPPSQPEVVTEEAPAPATHTSAPEILVTETVETQAVEEEQPENALTGVTSYSFVPEESTVTYEVGETFIEEGNRFNVAIGQTQGITGEVQVNFDEPNATTFGPITIDVVRFTSDSARRDNAIRERFLQSSQYPTVTFTPTGVAGLPETIEPGVEYNFTATGDLTIRDTTQPATFDVQASLDGEAIRGIATTTFLMSDFGFGPIDILGVLSTEDEVKITVNFVAAP